MTTPDTPHGPYETEGQVSADLGALYARAAEAGETDLRRARVRLLLGTLARLGVGAGSYDQLILASVGQHESVTTMVLVGLIERAHAAGRDALPKEIRAADERASSGPTDGTADHRHALMPLYGRMSSAGLETRCGADGVTVVFAEDVTCPACIALMAQDHPAEACGRCAVPFDPTDTTFDGRARYADTLFCRGCIDQCHEADADHRCIICLGNAR